MLAVSEFTVSTIADAKPLSLVLPRSEYEETYIVGHISGFAAAMSLSGIHKFAFYKKARLNHNSGLIIDGIFIEVDKSSAYNAHISTDISGSIIRENTKLVACAVSTQPFKSIMKITLNSDLPLLKDDHSVGFTKWSVCLGSGAEKRVLFEVDATPQAA